MSARAKAKPSLSGLMEQQKGRRTKAKAARTAASGAVTAAPPPPQTLPADTKALARKLLVRRFVTAYLKNGFDGSKAYREAVPDVKRSSSWTRQYELLQDDDVRDELARQLRGIFNHADLDEDWVKSQWRAMAQSSIFDYVKIGANGAVSEFMLDPAKLTREQQLNIRGMKFDKDTGKVVDIRLVDRQLAVDSVAKALKMFNQLEDSGLKDLVKDITERMQAASKRVRTFDNDTGEEIA